MRYGGGFNKLFFGNTPVYGPKSTLGHYAKNIAASNWKGFGVGTVLGNIPDRMYPTNKSLYRDRKVITMPGKLDFKYKKPARRVLIRHRSVYLRNRYVKKRNKFLL
jgi:hypothetical protein